MSALLKEVFNVPNKEETFCSSCNNTNWQKTLNPNGNIVIRRCLENIHLRDKLFASGVFKKYQSCSFTSYIPNNAIENQVKEVFQNLAKTISQTKTSIVLSSSKPNGKTHLAVSLIRELIIESFIQTRFIDFTELANNLDIESILTPNIKYSFPKESICKSDLLIIDDLKIPNLAEQKSNLEYVIHYRHRNFLPLIITTRLKSEELYQILSPPIYSRLEEMCSFISLELDLVDLI